MNICKCGGHVIYTDDGQVEGQHIDGNKSNSGHDNDHDYCYYFSTGSTTGVGQALMKAACIMGYCEYYSYNCNYYILYYFRILYLRVKNGVSNTRMPNNRMHHYYY